jgi:hypothetical protein
VPDSSSGHHGFATHSGDDLRDAIIIGYDNDVTGPTLAGPLVNAHDQRLAGDVA